MIVYIRGLIEEFGEDYVIVDNNGIGYYIAMPINEIEILKNHKGVVKINIYHHIREDAEELFGFMEKEGLNMFKMLLGVSGVGPKAALSMLSSLSPQNMIASIISGDEKNLCKAQGVGKKLAQRIILELKDKFKNYDFLKQEDDEASPIADYTEAIGALVTLGYTRQEALSVIKKIDCDGKGIEDIVKLALKALMKG